jgi:hypothetical protein
MKGLLNKHGRHAIPEAEVVELITSDLKANINTASRSLE